MTIAFAQGACEDTTEDLIYLRAGIPKSEVIGRLGNGISPDELPSGLADHLSACPEARYYKSEYRSQVARSLLGDPAAQSYWRVCFSQDRVGSVDQLGLISR